jgi:hypothetical protein
MVSTLLKALVVFGSLLASPSMAVEQGNLSGFSTGDSSFTDVSFADDAVRVKVPLKMTLFESIVVKGKEGTRRIEHKALAPVKYNFKATIDRTNHFYVSGYHVETVPLKWDHDTKFWTVEVNFFKRFGEGQELEEAVGSMTVRGSLEGARRLYVLKGQAEQVFNDKLSKPLLKVEMDSQASKEKGSIARRQTPAAL